MLPKINFEGFKKRLKWEHWIKIEDSPDVCMVYRPGKHLSQAAYTTCLAVCGILLLPSAETLAKIGVEKFSIYALTGNGSREFEE